MSRVLLVSAAPSAAARYANTLPPLGILGIASYLRAHGHTVGVIDRNVEPRRAADYRDFDWIGFSLTMANVAHTALEAARAREAAPRAQIAVGGPMVTAAPATVAGSRIGAVADALVAGEGEHAFRSLVEGVEDAPGVMLRRKGFAMAAPPAPIEDLDALPFPALGDVPLDRYRLLVSRRRPVSSIMTSRGCPYGCVFCDHSLGRRFRARSPHNVADEIDWQSRRLGVRELAIEDDNFSLDLERAARIAEELARRAPDAALQFQNGLCANHVDRALVRLLKRAGVWLLGLAPESGAPGSLEKIGKHFDLDQVVRVREWCRAEGIRTFAYFMVGFPWEDAAAIERSLAFIGTLDPDYLQIARVVAIPGTRLHETTMAPGAGGEPGDRGFFHAQDVPGCPVPGRVIDRMVRRAYRCFYLHPRRLLGSLLLLPPRHIVALGAYAVRTGNI